MVINETNYLVPNGLGNSQIAVQLEEIIKAEQRMQEIVNVNNITAPGLLVVFNENWLTLNKTVARLTFEKNIASNCLKVAEAEAKLECTEEILQKKGHHKASADLREAFVRVNKAVQDAQLRFDEICFVLDILEGKKQAFYNAYCSVKKLLDTQRPLAPNYSGGNMPAPY
jgi:hypothetical protein